MTYQTGSTAAHSFRVENVEWKVHGAHVHVQYTPPENSGKETSDSDIFVFETGPYVAQADLRLAMFVTSPVGLQASLSLTRWVIESNA